ncbi:hypothetical protein JOF56_002510 [Kibdelosporangium banguiense]|uniref:Uncharacterized protein n=1 Tax=Kibdelosporangium banguiense TaxID=1365924 RepID=A0ABS4TCH2_9PSEU|nr:hypothetical protein [Kibdelosporangium banguiense]
MAPPSRAAPAPAVTVRLVQGKDFAHRRCQVPEFSGRRGIGFARQPLQAGQALDHRVPEGRGKDISHGVPRAIRIPPARLGLLALPSASYHSV